MKTGLGWFFQGVFVRGPQTSKKVRFKTSLQFAGETLAPEMIEQCLLVNIFTMKKYLPGILQMIFTDSSAATVIPTIEDHSRTPSPESF